MVRGVRAVDRRLSLDLAAHLSAVSTPPDCGPSWRVQSATAFADEAAIGGDFMVFTHDRKARRLQAVVVDASGKGAEAATRSVMLAGAISGLLGEVPSDVLLPAVNRHVHSLGWEEHFATAAHLDLDLTTGAFRLGVAGHPSPVHFDAGSGRWSQYGVTGPALGFLEDVEWDQHTGRLAPGDALIVVTDGMVEDPKEDLEWGVDRLMGQAERLVLTGFQDGAETLLAQRKRAGSDDAQVLLVNRLRP